MKPRTVALLVHVAVLALALNASADTATTTSSGAVLPWEAWLALGLAALGGVGMILRGVEIVIGLIAKRTKTTWDDDLHRKIDDVADTLDEIRGALTGLPKRDSQAGRAAMGLVAMIASIGLVGLASSCAPTTREATIKTALVTVDSARAAFVAYSKVKHEQIARSVPTRAEGERRLDALEVREDIVLKAFVAAYAAIGVAATLHEDQGRDAIRSAIEQVIAAFNAMTRGEP